MTLPYSNNFIGDNGVRDKRLRRKQNESIKTFQNLLIANQNKSVSYSPSKTYLSGTLSTTWTETNHR